MSYIDESPERPKWPRPQISKSSAASVFETVLARLRQAETWLDSKGRKAWIAAMVAGFIFVWPVGLFLLVYMTYANKWSKQMFKSNAFRRENGTWARFNSAVNRSSGNSAFDAYKADTLRRLEEEQDAFEAFLERLRAAKDKQEFDAFMEDRAKAPKADDMALEPAESRTI